MKLSLIHVWNLAQPLAKANSQKGQGRHFIKANRRAVLPGQEKAIEWLESYADEYKFPFERSPMGGYSFNLADNPKAMKAFTKFLRETIVDFEPYQMTEEVMQDIDGIDMNDEANLFPLFTGFRGIEEEEDESEEAEPKPKKAAKKAPAKAA